MIPGPDRSRKFDVEDLDLLRAVALGVTSTDVVYGGSLSPSLVGVV
jgi:hypothetical protein